MKILKPKNKHNLENNFANAEKMLHSVEQTWQSRPLCINLDTFSAAEVKIKLYSLWLDM